MPDNTPNGNDQPSLEQRVGALEQARRELEDAFLVMTHLETRQSNLLREQSEYMANFETRLRQAEHQDEIQREKNRELDERIAALVSGIGRLPQPAKQEDFQDGPVLPRAPAAFDGKALEKVKNVGV